MDVQVYYCEEDQVCLYKDVAFEIPFSSPAEGQASQSVQLSFSVKPTQMAKGFVTAF